MKRIVAVAFEGETDQSITALVDEGRLGQGRPALKLINAFTDRGVTQCVMLGQIAPKNLSTSAPTSARWGCCSNSKRRNARTIFGAIAK